MKGKRKLFYISAIGLYLFTVFGQWVCGLVYDNQSYSQQREMRLRMLAVIAVCVLCVWLLRGGGRKKRVWRMILGSALSVCIVTGMAYTLLQFGNTRDSYAVHPRLIGYEGEAHWTAELDWREEKKTSGTCPAGWAEEQTGIRSMLPFSKTRRRMQTGKQSLTAPRWRKNAARGICCTTAGKSFC